MNEDMVDTENIKLGHSLACVGSMCRSKLRLLRAASVYYPALRNILFNVYHVRKSHAVIATIDDALQNSNALPLLDLLKINEYEELYNEDNDLCLGEECVQGVGEIFIAEGLPHLETRLEVVHANIINQYFKKLDLDAEHPSCSCERLFLRTDVSEFNFSDDKYNTDAWKQLKHHMLDVDPNIVGKSLYVCGHCRPVLNKNHIPNWCILNGLITELLPNELAVLNLFERQLIKKAKAFQTIIRLGTYTGKVPAYNSLKAIRGTMFILPIPMDNTFTDLCGISSCLPTLNCTSLLTVIQLKTK